MLPSATRPATGRCWSTQKPAAAHGSLATRLHDDAKCETIRTGPGPPNTKVGTFPQALYDQAKKQGWTVISMKND